jgi:hypothetical protein
MGLRHAPIDHARCRRVALYLAASPLVESGNPWALEYVAARPESGRVMLSARSGTAEALPEAILVDPDQPEQLTKGLARAAHGTDDPGTTWQQGRAYVVGYDCHAWARRFRGALRWRERAVSNAETDRRWTAGFNLAPTVGTARPIVRTDWRRVSEYVPRSGCPTERDASNDLTKRQPVGHQSSTAGSPALCRLGDRRCGPVDPRR